MSMLCFAILDEQSSLVIVVGIVFLTPTSSKTAFNPIIHVNYALQILVEEGNLIS